MDSETTPTKRWQAEIWSGESSAALTLTRVYGPSLEGLREAAQEFLLERRPACFANLSLGSVHLLNGTWNCISWPTTSRAPDSPCCARAERASRPPNLQRSPLRSPRCGNIAASNATTDLGARRR